MNRALGLLCPVLLAVGLGLLVAAAAQDVAGVEVFDDPPWVVGVALATIGGLMTAAFRRRRHGA